MPKETVVKDGDVKPDVKADVDANVKPDVVDESYLGTWKDKDAATEGVANLQTLVDSQGNELGALRKQAELSQQVITDLQGKTQKAEPVTDGPDYAGEIATIQKQMLKLDPVDDSYHADLMRLMNEANVLSAKAQHERTMDAATTKFTEVLNERDITATHKAFYRDNPDFNTPEMQTRINERMAQDTTGMSDPLVAYREIQRDDLAAEQATLAEENAEMKRLLDLSKGTDETGKVITKGQSPAQQKTKQPKATGADLDEGMQAALSKLRG